MIQTTENTLSAQSKILRDAPAYQEYASDILADRRFRAMSLSERGLLLTLKCECWVNKSVPLKLEELSSYLGVNQSELQKLLTPRITSFLVTDGDSFKFVELENQKHNYKVRKDLISQGGRNGGLATQNKNRMRKESTPPQATPKALSRDEVSGTEERRVVSNNDLSSFANSDHSQWLTDFE
jgi:hypothetical protein